MNRKILKSRYIQVIFFVVILMLILCVRLFVLTVVQEEKWAEAAKNQNTKEVLLSAPRGKIYDRYGRVLAGNKQIFTVTFNASGLSTEQINASAYRTIRLLEKNGDTYVDNFPIKITKSGKFYYTYDSSKKNGSNRLAFPKMRRRNRPSRSCAPNMKSIRRWTALTQWTSCRTRTACGRRSMCAA